MRGLNNFNNLLTWWCCLKGAWAVEKWKIGRILHSLSHARHCQSKQWQLPPYIFQIALSFVSPSSLPLRIVKHTIQCVCCSVLFQVATKQWSAAHGHGYHDRLTAIKRSNIVHGIDYTHVELLLCAGMQRENEEIEWNWVESAGERWNKVRTTNTSDSNHHQYNGNIKIPIAFGCIQGRERSNRGANVLRTKEKHTKKIVTWKYSVVFHHPL